MPTLGAGEMDTLCSNLVAQIQIMRIASDGRERRKWMSQPGFDQVAQRLTGRRLSRRRAIRSVTAGAAVAALTSQVNASTPIATPGASSAATNAIWETFSEGVREAMKTFDMVGAAVALVTADGIAHSATFGVKDQASGAPITPDTHFQVASTTKSMSSLLIATLVDDGALSWNQPVREVWTDFRAPTDELTKTMRVRDLLAMDSGIGEPESTSSFHQGDLTAADVMQSLAIMPVIAPPHTRFFYNNTVYAVGGYLPALLKGASLDTLGAVNAQLMNERVYGPVGMRTARLTDDPRPFVDDYATGYGTDFIAGTAVLPYAPVGGFVPVGGTLASLNDMASYIIMQLRGGMAIDGTPVVSAENLAECWKPHIAMPVLAAIDPDLRSAGYCMGWIRHTYKDGRSFVWHNGGIDGFTTYIGFFPADNLGLVILTNINPIWPGTFFTTYVLDLLLNVRFGLDRGSTDAIAAQYQKVKDQLNKQAAQARPVDPKAIAPYLGYYEKGWLLAFDDEGTLRLHQNSRALPLLVMPDGSYVMAGGTIPGNAVTFTRDNTGMRWMTIKDIETVRRTTGGS